MDSQACKSFEFVCTAELASPLAFTILLSASLPGRPIFKEFVSRSTGLM